MIRLVIILLIELRMFQKIHDIINSETITNEHAKEIPQEKFISPEKR